MLGEAFAVLTGLFYGWSSIYIKKGSSDAGQYSAVYYSLLVNSLLFLPLILLSQNHIGSINILGLLYFGLSGIAGPVVGRICLYKSIQLLGSSRASALKISAPVFCVFLGMAFLQEEISWKMLAGVAVIILGVCLIGSENNNSNDGAKQDKGQRAVNNYGFLLGVLSAFLFAITNLFRKAGLNYFPAPIVGSAVSVWVALALFVVVILIKGDWKKTRCASSNCQKNLIIASLWSGLAIYCYFKAMSYITMSATVAIASAEPLFVILLGACLYKGNGDSITLRLWISALTIIAGVAIIMLH